MILHIDGKKQRVRTLLDTGCSIALINQATAEKLGVEQYQREKPRHIQNYTGEHVPGAGQYYTAPLLLQHRRHFTKEKFEVSPMDPEVDLFLPFEWIMRHPPQGYWTTEEVRFNSPACREECTKFEQNNFTLSWDDSVALDTEARIIGYVAAALKDEDPLKQVPLEFHQYLGIMKKEAADALPEHRPYDCKIELKEGATAPWGPIYPLSEQELQTLREWLKEMEKTGKIKRSTSPAGSPILFVPKPNNRGLRLCVDYRGLNAVTIPNRYPLPLMQELQDRVRGAQWFTKMDLKNGFNLIRIRKGDEWKTAFRTRYGLYEFQVMPFGLTNAPSTFQDMMNHVLSDVLDVGVLAYMDDILVYAETEEEHDQLVREVLKRLQQNGLAVSPEKCVWKTHEVEFLGYVIGRKGISMSQDKVEAVLSWRTPNALTEVQSFLGFANFYRRFIKDYSGIARPLTELTKKTGKEWSWNPEAETAFQELKKRFTTAPILAHFDASRPIIIETDASDFAIGAVLSQRDNEKRLHPVAFHSRKFQPAEINYDIHDKELLAIVDAFKQWRRYCEGAEHLIQVFTDHHNLEYFTTTKVLNRRQARWAEKLASIDFRIHYRPGTQNGKPDALSRRTEYRPEKGGIENQPITTALNKNHFEGRLTHTFVASSARLASLPTRKWSLDFAGKVKEAAVRDPAYQQAKKEAASKELTPKDRKVKEGTLREEEGLLYRKGALWVPEATELIQTILESEHDTKVAGHMGQDKTIELIRRNFWWPKMNERIIDFVRSCPECQQNKAARHQPYGLSSPLELPYAPWQSIAMDFITELPVSEGCDQLWVVIDRFTKMAHFIPLREKTASDLAKVFAREVWRFHGTPTDIVSDRDSRFTSETWKEFLAILKTRPRMSTAFHPQTDGQTERLNQTIEAYLRTFVSKEQDDWARLLPMAEFAYNNSVTTGNGMSPFYANYGFHPRTLDPPSNDEEPLNPASMTYGHWMQTVHEESRKNLEEAQERMRRYADPARKEPPAYQVGDMVMLNGRNIKTRRPSKKLDHKNHGPFQIEKIVSPLAVRLTLPRKWKIHNVFHVSLLEPYRTSEHRAPPDPAKVLREADDIEQSEEYDVEEVMSSRKHGRRILYLVKWLDYPDRKDWTEEPFDNFSEGGLEKLREFHQRNPDALKDYRLNNA